LGTLRIRAYAIHGGLAVTFRIVKPMDESELRRVRIQTEDLPTESTIVRLLATLDDRQARAVAYLRGWEDGPGVGYPDGMADVLQTVADQLERGDHLRGALVRRESPARKETGGTKS
jgi:hypothetical protein